MLEVWWSGRGASIFCELNHFMSLQWIWTGKNLVDDVDIPWYNPLSALIYCWLCKFSLLLLLNPRYFTPHGFPWFVTQVNSADSSATRWTEVKKQKLRPPPSPRLAWQVDGPNVPDGVLGDDDMTKKLQKLEGHLLRKSRVDEELRPLNAVLQMLCCIIRITHTYYIYIYALLELTKACSCHKIHEAKTNTISDV